MKPGSIPTARVAPIMHDLIRERWPHGGGIDVLSEKVGCDWGSIASIIDQKNEGTDFNLVDTLLCALGRPDLWWGVLSDIYWLADIDGEGRDYLPQGYERCQRIGCGALFKPHHRAPKSGIHKPKFCSKACGSATHKQNKKGGFKRGAYGRGLHLKSMVCAQGHDLTADNLCKRKDGKKVCKTCHRERQRIWAASKRAKLRAAA